MKNNNRSVSGIGESQASIEQKNSRLLKLGLDMHYRQVTAGMQEEAGRNQSRRKNGPRGFWELGGEKAQRGLGDPQLLRSRSQRLLVTSRIGGNGSEEPGGSTQSDGPRQAGSSGSRENNSLSYKAQLPRSAALKE